MLVKAEINTYADPGPALLANDVPRYPVTSSRSSSAAGGKRANI